MSQLDTEPPAGRSGHRGLLFRLVAITVAAGVVVGVIGAAVQSATARDALRGEIAERNAALAIELAARIDSRIASEITMLELVANRRNIARLDAGLAAELRAVLGATAEFDELVVYDDAGQPLAAAASAYLASPETVPVRDDLAVANTDLPAVQILDEFPPVLEMAVAIDEPPGTTSGVLVGRLPLHVIAGPALRVDPATTVTSFMVAADGQIVVHPERDRVLRRERIVLEEATGASGDTPMVRLDGGDHLIATAPMAMLPASTVITQLESVALAPVRDQLRDLTLILVLVMAATVLAVGAAGTWLLAPLRPLVSAVRSLGRDERDVRVDERGRGEVGVLAREFNRLATALDRRRAEIGELQRLSLLVNTRTSRDTVAAEVTDGAARLLDIEQAAFCVVDDTVPEVVAAHGDVRDATALEQAATVLRIGRSHRAHDADGHHAAVPIPTVDGRSVGALVVSRPHEPFRGDELALLETYAAFAGVALENVGRLELEQRLAAELAEAVEHRRGLIGSVSHELRTPLACIDGFSSMLIDHWTSYDDDERRDLLGRVRHHSRELEELVSRLLDFAVTERGTLEAALQPVRLAELLDDVVASMQPMLDGRSTTVDTPDVTVRADPVMLRRALSNLLSNAVKYSAAGTAVAVRAVDDGRRVRVEVIDEGIGLSADEAAQAFEPFWRSSQGAARPTRGAGLGLALVAEYARAMGGAAGVVSEPGHGSTFFVTLLPVDAPAD